MDIFVTVGPFNLSVTFDKYGDIESILDDKTGTDVEHLFNRETLNLIESSAREIASKKAAAAKFDYAIDSLEYV